jgi:hypothetical protein
VGGVGRTGGREGGATPEVLRSYAERSGKSIGIIEDWKVTKSGNGGEEVEVCHYGVGFEMALFAMAFLIG